jgi:gamma-glutamyltranspeptidase / glutathione hydrolase
MFTTRPEIAGTFGVVATTHWIASQVGMAVLERGGNAFDAAAAAGFVLNVAEPHLNGPGGDAPIIIHDASANTQHVICGQGVSPDAATPAKFASLGLDLVPGTGLLPAVVPGAFDAWTTMLRNWGTWELADVLAFAIGYARKGIHIVPRISATIETMRPLFEQAWPSSAAVFLPGGAAPAPGSLFARPDLADTWERLLGEAVGDTREGRIDAARNAFYRGFVAEAVGDYYATHDILDASGRHHRGLLTAGDMARWAAPIEVPMGIEYRGHTLLKCGPWSQGPTFLQTLALLRGFDIDAMDPLGPEFVHTVVEALKLSFADREAYYGDPNCVQVPMEQLLSADYNDARRRLITGTASLELRPGHIEGFEPVVDHNAAARGELLSRAPGVGEPTVSRLGAVGADTCHVDVIDRWGNMVSATPSGGWLQSSPVVPGLGFCLSTRGQMFWTRPGLPNSVAPRKRPRTTLSPSMVLRDGRAWMSFGTPGGEQQDQWQPIMFLRMIHHNLTIQQAIDVPSFHTEHWPSSFWPRVARPGKVVLEGRYPPSVLAALQARGHLAEMGGDWSEGRLSAAKLEADGQMFAGANPRGMQGYAVGR